MSLFDSGSKGVKFESPGDTIVGTVTAAPREQQQTKYGTQTPDTWPDGSPKMQILVPLQTDLREDENDDGTRTLYVASKNMKRAIAQAMRDAKAPDVEAGGQLTVSFTGLDPQSKNPQNPAKLYSASYIRPTSGLSAAGSKPQTVAEQHIAGTPPRVDAAFIPAPQPAAPVITLSGQQQDTVKQLAGMGLDADKIAQSLSIDPVQVALVLAA